MAQLFQNLQFQTISGYLQKSGSGYKNYLFTSFKNAKSREGNSMASCHIFFIVKKL